MNCYNTIRILKPRKDRKASIKHKGEKNIINYQKLISLCAEKIDDMYLSHYFRLRKKRGGFKYSKPYDFNDPMRLKVDEICNFFYTLKKFSKKLVIPLVVGIYERENRNFIYEKKKFQKDFTEKIAAERVNNYPRMGKTEIAIWKLLC